MTRKGEIASTHALMRRTVRGTTDMARQAGTLTYRNNAAECARRRVRLLEGDLGYLESLNSPEGGDQALSPSLPLPAGQL